MKKIVACTAVLLWATVAQATITVLDNFEVDEGHFYLQPTFSGSTSGVLLSSTADRVTTEAYDGIGSQALVLLDDPAATGWNVRHLSGGGSPGNNVALAASGITGYYLKTSTPGLTTRPGIDDGAAGGTERGVAKPVIDDGAWHLYTWNFSDPADWDSWVGASNGQIDGPTVTYDAVWISSATDQDATVYFDYLYAPEPASLALLCLGGLVAVRRRR
ncbi:MAG: PEP-CTERM sorting domain-containing protein [Phycisphaerales bacterium]|nr:PEP-CTERM sorting domain-containing protein [Phycisphaerales bacterium]